MEKFMFRIFCCQIKTNKQINKKQTARDHTRKKSPDIAKTQVHEYREPLKYDKIKYCQICENRKTLIHYALIFKLQIVLAFGVRFGNI